MREVTLHGARAVGRVALVDDIDYDLVSEYHWNVSEKVRDGKVVSGPYAISYVCRNGNRQLFIKMHKLITGWPETDHKDGNGLNNQRSNLRDVTHQQNMMNTKAKGYTWDKERGKWHSQIMLDGKNRFLGRFDSEDEARRAYTMAAGELFGEFANNG